MKLNLPGLVDLLRRDPFALDTGVAKPLSWEDYERLRPSVLAALREVAGHRYRTDRERTGKSDHWEPVPDGDCEDKALALRDRLVDAGVPRSCLRLWLVQVHDDLAYVDHVVLTLRATLSGGTIVEVVLDPTHFGLPQRREDLLGFRNWRRIDPATVSGAEEAVDAARS
jgi:hypothetical protein